MSTLQEAWVPRTSLGKMVQEGKITSLSEIFSQGYRIREAGIVDTLLPNIQQEDRILCTL